MEADRAAYATEISHEMALGGDIERIRKAHGRDPTTGRDPHVLGAKPACEVKIHMDNLSHGGLAHGYVGRTTVWTEDLEKDIRGRYSEEVVEKWLGVAAKFTGDLVTVDIANELEPEGNVLRLKQAVEK